MWELRDYQQEIVASALQSNILLSCPRAIGKTYIAAWLCRQHLQPPNSTPTYLATNKIAHHHNPPNQTSQSSVITKVVAVAATKSDRIQLHLDLNRLCSRKIYHCDQIKKQLITPSIQKNTNVKETSENPKHQLIDQYEILVLSPKELLEFFRKRILTLDTIGLLILEGLDQIHTTTPSFFPIICDDLDLLQSPCPLRLFTTARLAASKLHVYHEITRFYKHIQVMNIVPIGLTPNTIPVSRFPPIVCEPIEENCQVQTIENNQVNEINVREFLLGENDKKVDLVRMYRKQLEFGNSAAIYDAKKKQEKVNKFMSDAELVYSHLGQWCFLKFIELELQLQLQACAVDDVNSRNHKIRRTMVASNDVENENGEVSDNDEDMEEQNIQDIGHLGSEEEVLAALFGSKVAVDDENLLKFLRKLFKVIRWLVAQANACGIDAATPRLRKTANLIQTRFENGDFKSNEDECTRVWVFISRRCHCRVVSEYLTEVLDPLQLPPSCCMLGNTNARVSRTLRFSSYLKVMTMFIDGKTQVMVTTSMAKSSQKMKRAPPLCNLIVVMDELIEADKLMDFAQRGHPTKGIVRYLTNNTVADRRRFDVLLHKLTELMQIEFETMEPTGINSSSAPSIHEDNGVYSHTQGWKHENRPSAGTISTSKLSQQKFEKKSAANPYEIVDSDTKAVLNLDNSVNILSNFCDTLPGLDTYDRRPQYIVKRHQLSNGLSAATKLHRKKRLKYNCKLDDKIDDCKAAADAKHESMVMNEEGAENQQYIGVKFEYSASLRLPTGLGIKKQLVSSKVESDNIAKGIVAFKACQELIKKGFLDRHFRSRLLDDESSIHGDQSKDKSQPSNDASSKASTAAKTANIDAETSDTIFMDDDNHSSPPEQLKDMSTQTSYDLPPVSAVELRLRPVRSLLTDENYTLSGKIEMCFYGLSNLRLAILCSNKLYTGNTNTSWRYEFATSEVMTPSIQTTTLQKIPTIVQLTKDELQKALHFHLINMRLACMTVSDALRDINVVGDQVWREFSEQNDKGYLVVPSLYHEETNNHSLDWDYVNEIIGKPLLTPLWPFPKDKTDDEWICVPTDRTNVAYVVKEITLNSAADLASKYIESPDVWATHQKKGKSTPGNPILGRWYTMDHLVQIASQSEQTLIHVVQIPPIVPLIRRVLQRNYEEASISQSSTCFNERLIIPQFTSILRLSKRRFFDAMGIIPLLYEFERKCQMSSLMESIGLEVDMVLLDSATSKPAYERMEILGDTYLKLETTWYMYQNRKDIADEGQLTQLRRDIIRNDRLNGFALAARLQHYILYPAEFEQHPFQCWKPSCMGKTPQAVVAPSKWIADVLEAICGAYLIGQGEKGARYFLNWIGVKVLEKPHFFVRPFYPDIFPCAFAENIEDIKKGCKSISTAKIEDLSQRLLLLQSRLKYTFKNVELLLEAITHSSVGILELHIEQEDSMTKVIKWRRNYERLEYLGDALIEYLSLSFAYVTYNSWLPGSLSHWKSATVSNDALGKTAIVCFGVDECICSGGVRFDHEVFERISQFERKYSKEALPNISNRETFQVRRKRVKPSKGKSHISSLPKIFADVFEALVAAVFLDSGYDLQKTRDIFLGPLLETVQKDAYAYVCHESGLAADDFTGDSDGMDLFSSDGEDL